MGLITKVEKPLFKTAVSEFLVWAESRLEKSTVRRYRIASAALIKAFGSEKVNKITSGDIEKFITKRSREVGLRRGVKPKAGKAKPASVKKTISASTINKELSVLKKIFNNLIVAKIINVNPVRNLKFLKENSQAGRVLNIEEERVYLMAASQPFQDFAAISIETGMRPDELCAITINDVNLDEGSVFIQKGKTKAARRLVPLSDRALGIIKSRIETATGAFLFAGGLHGSDPNSRVVKFNNSHYGALKRSKLDTDNRSGTSGTCTIYSFRHTFATRFIESGGDLLTLAAILGHSSLRMVMRYAHPSDAHKFEAIKRMSQVKRPEAS